MPVLCTAGSIACWTESCASACCPHVPLAAGVVPTTALCYTLILAYAGMQPPEPSTWPASLSNARTEDKDAFEGVNGGRLHCTKFRLLSAEPGGLLLLHCCCLPASCTQPGCTAWRARQGDMCLQGVVTCICFVDSSRG